MPDSHFLFLQIARKFLLAAALLAFCCGFSQAGTVWFTAPELRIAAKDLADFVSEKQNSPMETVLASVDTRFSPGDWVLANSVKSIPKSVEECLTPENRAYIQSSGQESFIAVHMNGVRYLVGGGHRGAVYASVRIQREYIGSATPPLSVESQTIRQVPVFKERAAGAGGPHPTEDYAQPKPDDYDWETYARDLAHAAVNLTPGIIQGQVVPDEVLRPWGIRKILAFSSCPFSSHELRNWRQSQPDSVKPTENPRLKDTSSTPVCPCPMTDFGEGLYKDWLSQVLSEHKEAAKLVFFFSDWGVVPGSGCGPGPEISRRIIGFLEEIHQIVKALNVDIQLLAATRGLSAEVVSSLIKDLPGEYGLYFEEPSSSLIDSPESGCDPSLVTARWNDTYAGILQQALQLRPMNTIPVIAAGDTDWMVSPAVGLASPGLAHEKIQRLHSLHSSNIALAMGGFHPWVYSPNVEIFKEMIWNPGEPADALISRTAARDFGPAAEKVMAVWDLFSQALQALPNVCRAQHFETFIRESEEILLKPPAPAYLKGSTWGRSIHDAIPFLLEACPEVIRIWKQGVDQLEQAQDQTEGESFMVARDLRDGVFWSGFFLQVLQSQYNLVRGFNLLKWMPEDANPDASPWKDAFLPLYRDEVLNCDGWQALLFTAPEPRIRFRNEAVNATALARSWDQKRQNLSSLIGN